MSDPTSHKFQVLLDELTRVSDIKEVLPKSCTLSEALLGSVDEGAFHGPRVQIRRVRMHPGDSPGKAKKACNLCHASMCSTTHRYHRSSVKSPSSRNT